MKDTVYGINFSGVPATNLITLYSHAYESMDKDPIINDPIAIEIIDAINPELENSSNIMFRKLSMGKLRKDLRISIATRAARYDQYAKEFIKNNPNGVIVNLGCGFDTRFHRIKLEHNQFYDLDLPEVIDIKSKLIETSDNYTMLAYSVFDIRWMSKIKDKNAPIMFIAEGLFMYLPQDDVENLVRILSETFKNSELLCEVAHKKYTKGFYKKMLEIKFKKQLNIGSDAYYRFGLEKSTDFEKLKKSINLKGEWSYLDTDNKKIGWIKHFKNFKSIKYTQWTVHYRL